jgi:acetyl-CoA synthetase
VAIRLATARSTSISVAKAIQGVAKNTISVPRFFNIGCDVVCRHDGARLALIEVDTDGSVRQFSFGDIRRLASQLANAFVAHGLVRGDRIAILLSQRHETAVAHVAIYLAGMIAVPLFVLFGEDALDFRLRNCGVRAIVTHGEGAAKIRDIRERLPDLQHIFCVDENTDGTISFHRAISQGSDRFEPVETQADDPALIIYTSGTTGDPKGALLAHRTLLGHLPGVQYPHNHFPQPGDRLWTPADWAWIGGLFDVLLPAWHFGVPVVAYRGSKFDPGRAVDLMAKCAIRNVFMPPTALRMWRQAAEPATGVELRSIASGGESLGGDLLDWGMQVLGHSINEFYGQTECNLVIGNGDGLASSRAGWTGRAIPGHQVSVVDNEGCELPAGSVGSIAIRRPDPVIFLGYWGNEAATATKFRREWLITGDMGVQDDEGYFRIIGREDDVITTAGYRVGPGEIETCLQRHPAVSMVAVVGVPDVLRTEAIKAVIVLADGHAPSTRLTRDIQDFVKTRLAAHEYPRIIEFVSELPMTPTGKIIRRALRAEKSQR